MRIHGFNMTKVLTVWRLAHYSHTANNRIYNIVCLSLLLSLLPLHAVGQTAGKEPLSHIVNPFIGTDYTGNTYPGAQVPFGMVQLSPDNGLPGWDRIAGYFYPDSTIAGFSHTHLSGTGAGDLYDISFLPVAEPLRTAAAPLGTHSQFCHAEEEAHAGYYAVCLKDYGIRVELTATERCGIQRYAFPKGKKAIVLLDLGKAMNWDRTVDCRLEACGRRSIRGMRASEGWARGQRVFFQTRFSHPYTRMAVDSVPVMTDGRRTGTAIKARFEFDNLGDEALLTVVTALSPTGAEGAENNLAAEAPHDDFEASRMAAEARWDEALGKIEVEGGTADERATFYTALYHALLAPTLYCDADGLYPGSDGKTHRAAPRNYSTFSLWDTYRAAHPLYTLLCPERAAEMVRSLLDFAEQNGRLPVWTLWGCETDMMIGYHAAAVIADAFLKNIMSPADDINRALRLCLATARMDEYRGIGYQRTLGYVPCDVKDPYNNDNWSLSRTLEYAFDDACIARLAERAGAAAEARELVARAGYWRNVYNPSSGYMQPRRSDGNFVSPFNPDDYTPDICESNARQYFWSVQHDIPGLIRHCGRKRFAVLLDSMFAHESADIASLPIFSTGMIGQYAHGNEPSHHVAYLYNYIGRPETAQLLVDSIRRSFYFNRPDGLCGNEDCGQMSAWYVFSALGFYPVDPASGSYALGTPLFPSVTLHLPGGKKLAIKAQRNGGAASPLVKRVRWNGRKVRRLAIEHSDLVKGGTLTFEMQ